MVSVLGPILTLRLLAGLSGLDSTIFENDEVEILPAELGYVEAKHKETVVRGRPWVPHKRIGTILEGTRLAVRGKVESRDPKGCNGKIWYAVWPYGFVCSEHVRATKRAPDLGPALPVPKDRRLPFRYAVVRHQGVPGFKNIASMHTGIVDKLFTKGMSMVIDDTITHGDTSYYVTRDGFVVPRDGVRWMGEGSDWQGVRIENAEPGPLFAWVRRDKTDVYAAPGGKSKRVGTLRMRERVWLHESKGRWRRIGPDRWVDERNLNEVVVMAPPEEVVTQERREVTGNDQWIDVDTGEQVAIAYRGETPVYATLIASGAGSPTPLGNYPLWAKVASIDMNNQGYEDNAYLVQGVPWVLLFQGHNALHGAYWHDRFGNRKSHGCVNLAPRDARWLFEWAGPWLPTGWTGYLPAKLEHSLMVHVRDSSARSDQTFVQQREWGPPNREEEKKRLEEAQKRREETLADSQGGFNAPRSLFSDNDDVPLLQR